MKELGPNNTCHTGKRLLFLFWLFHSERQLRLSLRSLSHQVTGETYIQSSPSLPTLHMWRGPSFLHYPLSFFFLSNTYSPPLTPQLLAVVVYPALQSELENIYVARNGHMTQVSQWDLTGILWETSLKTLTQLAWTCFIPFPWVSLFLPKIPCADWIQNDYLENQGDLKDEATH